MHNLSVHDLIVRRRMQESRRLLLHDTRSISAIALAVGYATASHFGVIFKTYHGLTPREFRRGGGQIWWHQEPVDEGPLP